LFSFSIVKSNVSYRERNQKNAVTQIKEQQVDKDNKYMPNTQQK
jgi:hypothetical protein